MEVSFVIKDIKSDVPTNLSGVVLADASIGSLLVTLGGLFWKEKLSDGQKEVLCINKIDGQPLCLNLTHDGVEYLATAVPFVDGRPNEAAHL